MLTLVVLAPSRVIGIRAPDLRPCHPLSFPDVT